MPNFTVGDAIYGTVMEYHVAMQKGKVIRVEDDHYVCKGIYDNEFKIRKQNAKKAKPF